MASTYIDLNPKPKPKDLRYLYVYIKYIYYQFQLSIRIQNAECQFLLEHSANVFDDNHGEAEQGHIEQDQLIHVLRLEALLKEPINHLCIDKDSRLGECIQLKAPRVQ